MTDKSNLQLVLESGAFAVTAELGPPKGADAEPVRRKSRILKGYCDAANITDNQAAVVRMASWAGALIAIEEGVEPIMQMTTRDRNVMALQSDLIGAWALGVRNILALSGDPIKIGNHPDAQPVSEVDSTALTAMISAMKNDGVFANGEKVPTPPSFFVASAANPTMDTSEKIASKITAGTDFFQSNIIYDIAAFKAWFEPLRDSGAFGSAPFLAGVTPPKSEQILRHMHERIPGVTVPDATFERMAGKEGKAAEEAGMAIAVDVIEAVRQIDGVAGVHLMAVAWEEAIPEIVERAGLR